MLHTRKKGDTLTGKNLIIRMRISYLGKTIDFPTGHNIDAAFWDAKKEYAKSGYSGKHQDTASINRTIDEYRAYANELFARYELIEKRKPDIDEIKALFNDMTGRSKIDLSNITENFYKIYDNFMQVVGNQNEWKKSTYTKFNTIKTRLINFDKNITFDTLTEEKLQAFVNYLQDIVNLRNTTTAKYYANIKEFLRWASEKNYYKGKAHQIFRPKFKGIDGNEKEVIHLEWDELIYLLNFEFPQDQPVLSRVRDVFCFCCFTGLRHSDVHKLTRSDIKKDHIRVVTEKTIDGINIELNKYSRAILKKYANIHFAKDRVLPVIYLQKMNKHLKEIGKIVGFDEPQRIIYFKKRERIEEVYPKWALLTTHCGRRTFIVNALYLGIPAEVIMKWTGHSDYDSMKPYIKIVDKLKKQEMSKFDEKGT
jgi:integrase